LKQHNNVHLKEEGKPYKKYIRRPKRKTISSQPGPWRYEEDIPDKVENNKLDSENELAPVMDDEIIVTMMSDGSYVKTG
jgi:hypothetical protein